MLVGVGECTLSPAAYSMLSDYFPPHRRTRPVSLYAAGAFLGSGMALIVGGMVMTATSGLESVTVPLLGQFKPWQFAFLVVAAPVLPLLILMTTLAEPARHGAKVAQLHEDKHLTRNVRTYLPMIFGFNIMASGLTFALAAWAPSFFIRVWHWTPREIGVAMGIIVAVATPAGMIFSGWLADRRLARGQLDPHLRLAQIAGTMAIVASLALGFAPNAAVSLVALAACQFLLGWPAALGPAALQAVVPNRKRGLITAWHLLAANLLGLGLAPTVVAAISDYIYRDERMVGHSLAITCMLCAGLGTVVLGYARAGYRRLAREETITRFAPVPPLERITA
jgi:MFS family permease